MVNVRRALADTSVFIGIEATRFDPDRFAGYEWGVSVVTLGELRLGVLQASGPEAAARRLSTYQLAQRFEPLGIDEAVSEAWALLVSKLRAAKLRVPINDSWIGGHSRGARHCDPDPRQRLRRHARRRGHNDLTVAFLDQRESAGT